MDKYQLNLLNKTLDWALTSKDGDGNALFNGNEIILTQNENYNVSQYLLSFVNSAIEKIVVGGMECKPNAEGKFDVKIDFDKPVNNMTYVFKGGIVDNCEVSINYIFANKESYDNKIEELKNQQLDQKANVHSKIGDSLINVYWCNSSDNVCYTKVSLYEANPQQLMITCKIEEGVFYKSFTGLAFNSYLILVEQFDKNDKPLYSKMVSCSLNDRINERISSLEHKVNKSLDDVKNAVRSSGKHTVTIG